MKPTTVVIKNQSSCLSKIIAFIILVNIGLVVFFILGLRGIP